MEWATRAYKDDEGNITQIRYFVSRDHNNFVETSYPVTDEKLINGLFDLIDDGSLRIKIPLFGRQSLEGNGAKFTK